MNSQNFDRDLQQHLSALAHEKQPERDLFPGIERALANEAEAAYGSELRDKKSGSKMY